ncbi:EAL domain-containing protein [Methylocaldum gracile]|uniref:EAL domain-containing protein n=1 Tax=unclassified Methylocaldum TaxID=2622260 RepID=UPI00105D69A9
MTAPLNLLVIEDSETDFLLIQRQLRLHGLTARCRRVVSCGELNQALEEESWDAVLSDYSVPGLDFEASLRLIQERFPDLPVILISGSIGEERAVELLKQGVWDFVLKDRPGRLGPAIERSLREMEERRVRHAAEKALRESELRFRRMAETIGEVFWLSAPDFRSILYVSPAFEQVWGRPCAELYANPKLWMEAVHAEDSRQVLRALEELAHGRHFDIQYRINRPDGTVRWINDRSYALCDDAGKVILTSGVASDITEQRQAEERLRQAATVFTSTQEGVIITDLDGNILTVNPAFTMITEYTEAEVSGKNPRLLQSGHHSRSFYQAMWHAIRTTGSWQGELWNRRKGGEIYPEWLNISTVRNEQGEAVNYVGVFTDITHLKRSETQLEYLAHYDPLTGLPNRLLLLSRLNHALERARRDRSRGAVLFLDLDRFKNVNDSLGHATGDELLQLASQRMRECLRETDTVARLGGDEFVVVLEELSDPENAASVAHHLIDRLSAPFVLSGGQEVYIGASLGIGIFPDDGDDADRLIQYADAALYQAKDSGRGTYHFYTESLTTSANERLALETRLRHALDRDEFVLHYQPLVTLTDGRIFGVEALLRWQIPDQGLLSPNRFIPLAEETGLIVPLGEWVLRTACRCMKAWLDAGLPLEMLAVNLSPRQFQQGDLHERIRAILAETGLPSHHLELEITETALMEDGPENEAKLAALKELGVRIAIDDFGTGYSSLAYLKRFPIDKLKIDQSFMRDIPQDTSNMEIAAAIIAMARNLKLEVLAEGVEAEAQLAFLKRHGCDVAQGYLFGRPMTADTMQAILEAAMANR